MYSFSNGKVKIVQNPQYQGAIKNPYELQFEANSDIRLVTDDDSSIGIIIITA